MKEKKNPKHLMTNLSNMHSISSRKYRVNCVPMQMLTISISVAIVQIDSSIEIPFIEIDIFYESSFGFSYPSIINDFLIK